MKLAAPLCRTFREVLKCGERSGVVGMIHVGALPGTPCSRFSVQELVKHAQQEAAIYAECGVDGVMIENMHDLPYVRRAGPEVTAVMTRVCHAVKGVVGGMPLGVQVLAGNNREALAVAVGGGAQFVRCEGFVFGHLADEGYIDACAGELLRYRKQISAEDVLIMADIKKKHSSHAITADLSVAEVAHAAHFFLADAVVITGGSTGEEPGEQQLSDVKKGVPALSVVVGSGVTYDNCHKYRLADALVVGSHFKEGGRWTGKLSHEKVARFVKKNKEL